MKIVVFGLTITSSWGNGHATLWRGLCRALDKLGHRVVFFERNVPYYAENRDMTEVAGGQLVIYDAWDDVRGRARNHLADADAAMVTSFCPDGPAAAELVLSSTIPVRAFYDLDTPVTLSRLAQGEAVPYLGGQDLSGYDIVLSYTGGAALDALRETLGARRVAPLYGHVDPSIHSRVGAKDHYRADLSYLGTYAADRQSALEALLIEPARRRPRSRFLIGGALYPQDFPWGPNIYFVRHLPPCEHPAFFSSSRLTLNVTRQAMAAMGWCPSGRLFEATACGAAVVSDWWSGLDEFFEPGSELLVAHSAEDVAGALDLSDEEVRRIAARGRERTLDAHTSDHRARELLLVLQSASTPSREREHMEA